MHGTLLVDEPTGASSQKDGDVASFPIATHCVNLDVVDDPWAKDFYTKTVTNIK